MPIGAIITLVVTLVALVVIGIVVLVLAGKPKYMKGRRFVGFSGRLKATVIVSDAIAHLITKAEGVALANFCADVNSAVRSVFVLAKIPDKHVLEKTEHIIVGFLDNETFVNAGGSRLKWYYEHAVAYLSKTIARFWGPDTPSAYIRVRDNAKRITLSDQGEPLVHELCHAYLDDYVADDSGHSDPRVWISAGGQNTLQLKARVIVNQMRR